MEDNTSLRNLVISYADETAIVLEIGDGETTWISSQLETNSMLSPSLSSSLLASFLSISSANILTCSSTIVSGEAAGASQASSFVFLGSVVPLASPNENFLGRYTMNFPHKFVGDEKMRQNGDCSSAVTPKYSTEAKWVLKYRTSLSQPLPTTVLQPESHLDRFQQTHTSQAGPHHGQAQ